MRNTPPLRNESMDKEKKKKLLRYAALSIRGELLQDASDRETLERERRALLLELALSPEDALQQAAEVLLE